MAWEGALLTAAQPFPAESLKAELERSLGFRLRGLTRLGGAAAVNFKAVRASDGLPFVVKCSLPDHNCRHARLVEHLQSLQGTKAAQRVFARECAPSFAGYDVVCLAWCEGGPMPPDRLTDEQFRAFLDAYQAFSAEMQQVKAFEPPAPVVRWREMALRKCRGWRAGALRNLLEKVAAEDVALRPGLTRVIHGDFHHGNLHFADGRLTGILDLEEMRKGYPTDDIVRLITCAAGHLRWYERRRKRRLVHLFGLAVRHMPYARQQWVAAIAGRFLYKVFMKTHARPRIGLAMSLRLAFRARFYAELERRLAEIMV